VKPAQFEYHAPASVAEALKILDLYSGEARLLAGGQSLLPMMNFRIASPKALVDLNRIETLAYIREDDGQVRIGAMTRQRQVEFSAIIRERLPLLSEAVKFIGHLPTRSRGTIGGSIAHADPSAEIPMILQALDGEVVTQSYRGERRNKGNELFRDALTTALEPDEILTEIRFPSMPIGAGYAVEEFARRHGDFAIAAIATMVRREGERCVSARIATCGIGPVSTRLRAAEAALEQGGLGPASMAEAARIAASEVQPMDDRTASKKYRRHLTEVLTQRSLVRAAALCREK
jgi:CO/xanthine dehydrogenase FAD-binding subunit